ncbi:MAG: methylenetetrahydrofolate reductase [NAD(P)H] [Planctomycetaceae bacterium]|nr:methylenetetrahydrofolate reductase [NAD(P)H] [Planctomycetaceae bacterium]
MHMADILARDACTASFEFFPPQKDAGWDPLFASIAALERLAPSFVSVTYGAGGSTRERTRELVLRLRRETSLDPVPHLTCVGHTRAEMQAILESYAAEGVSNILALRGDAPRGSATQTGDFPHAADLVRFIRAFNESGRHPDPRGFGIGVAAFPEGHPETPNTLRLMDHLKAKVDAGADWICTQLFFDNHAFLDWRERCDLAGIRVPICAGIMPVLSVANLHRMADLAACTHIPAKLMRALQRCGDDAEGVERVGIHWATEQCLELLDRGVRGIHFYTLNRSAATQEIFRNLGLKSAAGIR